MARKFKNSYQVIVSNVGQVYDGHSKLEARRVYREYVQLSTGKVVGHDGSNTRAYGESVTLMVNGDIFQEYIPMEMEADHADTN